MIKEGLPTSLITCNQVTVKFMWKLKKMKEAQQYDNFNDLSKLLIPWCGNAFVL